jgi:large subunit ribosomal protein L9
MKIILKEDVEKLGKCGEVKEVKEGFARNFLLPRNLAVVANLSNLSSIEDIKRQKTSREQKLQKESEKLRDKLEQISCTAEVLVGEEDKVFGSVTSADIAKLLMDKGFVVDKRAVMLEEPLKALGVYTVPVKIHPEVTANLKVWVVKQAKKEEPEIL